MSDVQRNKSVVEAYTQTLWVQGDVGAGTGSDFYADDAVVHNPPPPGVPPGMPGVAVVAQMFHAAFPDCDVTNEDLIAEGDRVVQRWRLRGTHQQSLMGIEATGRSVDVEGINIFRIENGKIVERWGLFDMQGLRAQLGAPPPGARPGS